MSIDVSQSLGDNSNQKFCSFDRKLKCTKQGHKQNPIMFICTQYDCTCENRLGCAMCFNDHDSHKESQILIEEFMIQVANKQNSLEPYFRDILDQSNYARTKDELNVFQYLDKSQKLLNAQMRQLQKQINTFFSQQSAQVLHNIELHLISQGFGQSSNKRLRAFYVDLHKLKGKPLSHLQKQDYEFLLQFVLNNELISQLEREKNHKNRNLQQITTQTLNYIEIVQKKSTLFLQEIENSFQLETISEEDSSQLKTDHHEKIQHKIVTSPLRTSRNKSASKVSYSAQQEKGRVNSPGQVSKSSSKMKEYQLSKIVSQCQPTLIKEYLTVQRVTLEDENFLCYLMVNYLSEDFLINNLPFLQKLAPAIFPIDLKIDLRKKMQIIQKHRASLLKILWENWMIDFLFVHLYNIPAVNVSYRLQNFDSNQQESFLLRLKKALSMHGMIVWFVVEQIQKPKPQILPMILFGQGNLLKEMYSHSTTVQNLNLPQFSLYYLQSGSANLLQSQNIGVTQSLIKNYNDFFSQQNIFQINKGNEDPAISAQMLCERINNLINMVKIGYLVDDKQILNVRDLEIQFQSLITNFDYFIKCLQKCFQKEKELAQAQSVLI